MLVCWGTLLVIMGKHCCVSDKPQRFSCEALQNYVFYSLGYGIFALRFKQSTTLLSTLKMAEHLQQHEMR